ncbi:MAG: S8 family serine peptidase [Pseudanabaena sp. RU_4_16]|nr:S8 family serine peptidase [Pseudanabaena sp. RU_4_16]
MMPDIRFAGGVFVDETSQEPYIYTENIFVKFIDEADPEDCQAAIREAGLTVKEELTYATNAFFAAAPEGTGERVFDMALALLARSDVEYCHPELLRRRAKKAIFPSQWHLKTTMINGTLISASANVEAAHLIAKGAGITISVIDDGIDIDHPELSRLGKIITPRDATLGTSDPRPKDFDRRYPDNHGTACAGVACADGGFGASGVAPEAKLIPIRMASGLGSKQEADAFQWAADNGADVISCSWGPADGEWWNPNDPQHNHFEPLPASTRLALDYVTTKGRGGKGCVVLFAAGNGNESVDNDGYASYERVIAVAACNDRGKRSVYSDYGKAVWCAFPSSDSGYTPFSHPDPLTPGIWTIDRVGARGYNPGNPQLGDAAGNYANDFGGTSSACPGAAGIAALVLAVNPNLKWQEVRDIFRRACDKIDPQGGEYDAQGHSRFYGYGRLNAETAVKLAKPQPQNSILISRNFNQPLPDLQSVQVAIDVSETQPISKLAVQIDILHTYIGDLEITLVPPASLGAEKLVLHNRKGGATRNLKQVFDENTLPALSTFKGKSIQGSWTLEISDRAARDVGTLVSFGLEFTLQN